MPSIPQDQRQQWADLFDAGAPPEAQTWMQLKMQATAIEDITELTGEDILGRLQTPTETE